MEKCGKSFCDRCLVERINIYLKKSNINRKIPVIRNKERKTNGIVVLRGKKS